MALELVASVLTIAQVVCVLIERSQKAIEYVEEVKSVNEPVKELLVKVKDLHRLTKTVASTYEQVESSVSSDSDSLRQIRKALVACKEHLERLKLFAFDLASLKSTTMRERFTIKRKMDQMKRIMHNLDQGIQWNLNMLQSGLACLNIEINATRRASEQVEALQAFTIPIEAPTVEDEPISPMSHTSRTLSDADTVFSPDPDLRLQRFSSPSLSNFSPRPSMSSTSSHAPSIPFLRTDSVTSATGLPPLASKNEWKDFEFHITRCSNKHDRIEEIREILQQHSDGAALARSKDSSYRNPLHAAAQRGDVDLARVLIDDYRADINAHDSKPYFVLDYAVAGKHRNFVALLLEKGVNEAGISKGNKERFRAMKRTILHERQVTSKARTLSQGSRAGVVT